MSKFQDLYTSITEGYYDDPNWKGSPTSSMGDSALMRKLAASPKNNPGVENRDLKGPDGTHSLGYGLYGKAKGKAEYRKVGNKFEKVDSTEHVIHVPLYVDDEETIENLKNIPAHVEIEKTPGLAPDIVHAKGDRSSLHNFLKHHFGLGEVVVNEYMNDAEPTNSAN